MKERLEETRPEWRSFQDEQGGESKARTGMPTSITSFDMGLSTVIGSSMKAPVRFAAFANAVGIHADDFDDTQLAVAEDRDSGLLTHPTAPVLPAALAVVAAFGAPWAGLWVLLGVRAAAAFCLASFSSANFFLLYSCTIRAT